MKLWIGVFSLSAALLTGCATTPADNGMPKDYSGPKATLSDSVASEGGSKAQVFAVTSIDGVRVYNTLQASRQASQGHGFALTTNTVGRPIAARPIKVGLIATHVTAAPIHEIASRAAGTFFRRGRGRFHAAGGSILCGAERTQGARIVGVDRRLRGGE